MRNTLQIVLLIGLLFSVNLGMSQTTAPKMCRSDEMRDLQRQMRPESKQEALEFEAFTRNFATQQSWKSASTMATQYTIPVVFHVFGTNFSGQTVDDALIIEALAKTNEDFQGLNDDYSTVTPLFQGLRSTLDITFALAKIDPSGNPTTGIVYHAERSGFGNGSGYDAQIQQFAWDNYKYMNVYIMLDLYNDGATNNSGVAWYPDTYMSDNNLARVVYNGRYLYGNTDKEFASVLTHEFGHWLNLAHTFDNGCSSPGDNVSDTPATTANSGTCNTTTEKCSGAGIPNGENYMDYSNCYKMYTQGQVSRMTAALTHGSRQPLWQQSNLDATGVGQNIGAYLSYSGDTFSEADANDGTIETTLTITGKDGAQFATSGNLTQGTHFTASGVPSGLSMSVNVANSTTATITLTGAASAHANANDASGMTITFLNAAISGGTSAIYNPSNTGLKVDFVDPYTIVYTNVADITVNSTATWQFFSMENGNADFGAWYDNGKLRIETYQKPLVSQGSTRNITKLAAGTIIGPNSNWVAGGAYPDEHDLRSATYQDWDGSTGYVGFQFNNAAGKTLNGWMQVQVNATGSAFTVLDYAYYEKPNGEIAAGSTVISPTDQITANFSASSTSIETGQQVTYTDNSSYVGSPITSWSWSFPGGSPSTFSGQSPPAVTYASAGNYNVSLTVTNQAGASNTETKSNYVTVSNPTGLVYCTSSGSRATYEHIANVEVGSFSNPSGAAVYSDFTDKNISLTKGDNAITLTPGFAGSAYNEYFRVWIDFNQDGDFTDAGELAFDAGSASNAAVSGNLTVPSNATLGATRMRVSMKYNSAPDACGSVGDGEVEDYMATIQEGGGVTPPVANFGSDVTSVQVGNSIAFSDASLNSPTSYSWTFEGGSPASSTSPNPVVSYAAVGNYSVVLTVSNAGGSDTKTVLNYVTVTPTSTTQYCAGSAALNYNSITNVSFGSINKASTWSSYSDYTSNGTSLTRGASETLTIETQHDYWSGIDVQAWIDWNGDGDFDDSGERVYNFRGEGPYTTTVTVPSNAAYGTTRMRVRLGYGKTPSPCEVDTYQGEVEDYSVNIGSVAGPSFPEFQEISVYPNPTQGTLHINGLSGAEELIVFDAKGQVVLKTNSTSIDLTGATKGVYLLKVISQKGITTKRFILE